MSTDQLVSLRRTSCTDITTFLDYAKSAVYSIENSEAATEERETGSSIRKGAIDYRKRTVPIRFYLKVHL